MDETNETTQLNQSEISEMDVKRANIIAQTFVEKVETVAPARITSTRDEKKSALKIRELYHKVLGLPSRMEPFTVRPLAGRFGIPILGVVYAVALAFYIMGVLIVHPVSYFFLTLAMALTFIDGTLFAVQVLMDRNTFNFIYPKRTSYNVLSTIEARNSAEYTLVLGSHYDSDMDRSNFVMFFKDKNLPKWLAMLLRFLSFLSVPTLFITTIAAICLPGRGVADNAFLFLFPTIFCGLAIFYLITYFSYKKRNGTIGREGLQGAALTLAVADYLRLHPESVPDNCRIIVASFGSKECGAKGSEQLILQHYGSDDLLINPVCLNFQKVGDNGNNVIQGDKQFKLNYDLKISNIAYNTLKKEGLNPQFMYNKTMVTDSTPFARRKIPSVTLDFRIGDNELINAYDDAFRGGVSASLEVIDYMRDRQEKYKGAISDDIEKL